MGVVHEGDFNAEALTGCGRIRGCSVRWQIIGDMSDPSRPGCFMNVEDLPADNAYRNMCAIGQVMMVGGRGFERVFHTRQVRPNSPAYGFWNWRNQRMLGGDFGERLKRRDPAACRRFIRFISRVDSRAAPLNLRMPGERLFRIVPVDFPDCLDSVFGLGGFMRMRRFVTA